MAIPIVQFWSANRPHIHYERMSEGFDVEVRLGQKEPAYLNAIIAARDSWRHEPGIIVLEQDIAIDPYAIESMRSCISVGSEIIWAAPYVLWPASTGKTKPEWAHAISNNMGLRVAVPSACTHQFDASWFGLGFTYLPGRLIDAAPDTEQSWEWQVLSGRLSELAHRLGIRIGITGVEVTHMHW